MSTKEKFNGIGVVGNGTAILRVKTENKAVQKENRTKVLIYTDNKKSGEIAPWGDDNALPQNILADVRKNGASTSGLNAVIDNHYGSGMLLFKETFENNKRVLTQQSLLQDEYKEIKKFLKNNHWKLFSKEIITDLHYFSIGFPEYVLSNDYKKIKEVYRQKAPQCRKELMDENTLEIKNVWISTKWHKAVSTNLDSKYAKPVRYIDPLWSVEKVKEYCKKHEIDRFIRPVHLPMLNEDYYPIGYWHSAYYSDWIKVSNSIPAFKKALFENQSTIKYHIEVDNDYFKAKYEDDWVDFTVEEKEAKRKEFVDFIDESLRDTENTGKSVWSMIYRDDEGKEIPGLKITAIDDKLKDGAFLPDAAVANDEILAAIGIDSCIISSGQIGSVGSGSGSDKRVAWDILSARSKSKREYTLSIFEFIQEYNGWDESLVAGFEDTQITTLDKNPTGTQKTANV